MKQKNRFDKLEHELGLIKKKTERDFSSIKKPELHPFGYSYPFFTYPVLHSPKDLFVSNFQAYQQDWFVNEPLSGLLLQGTFTFHRSPVG